MYKSCSRCGKIHPYEYKCKAWKSKYDYDRPDVDNLRSKRVWQKKSVEIRDRSNWLCAVCKDEGKYTYDGVEVHHITKLRENPDGLLDDLNLICLCKAHHKLADEGFVDKEYLRKLAAAREKEK